MGKEFEVRAVEADDLPSLMSARDLLAIYYDRGLLLRQSLVNLSRLAAASRLVAAYEKDSEMVIGTAAFPFEYVGPQGEVILEFGAWSVDEKWLGSGVGMSLFYGACQLLEQTNQDFDQMIALSKAGGAKIFESKGALKINPWINNIGLSEPCGTCIGKKNKRLPPGAICCNQVYDVTKLARP